MIYFNDTGSILIVKKAGKERGGREGKESVKKEKL